MKWFWKVPSPKFVYITMNMILYVLLIGAIAWLWYTVVYESFDALIIANVFCIAGLLLAIITLGYWSIINKILEKEGK